MGFVDKDTGGIVFKRSTIAGHEMNVACGSCMGCRVDRSQEWAARIVHEAAMHQENCFVTLTYDSENVPRDGSLDKSHFQKFMKRLRKHFNDRKIRYYHCGEYGEKLERPHYHACLFGVDFDDAIPFSTNNAGIETLVSDTLATIWGKGFCTVGELNYETAAYTARYIMKKITGIRAEEHYLRVDPTTGEMFNLEPEYTTMSLGREKGDGIGAAFFKKYESDFFPSDQCPVPGRGVYNRVPKYYEKLWAEKNPDAFAEIKKRREKYRNTHLDEYTPQRLEAKFKVKKAQMKLLPRN
jgi:hypothetical protein